MLGGWSMIGIEVVVGGGMGKGGKVAWLELVGCTYTT
jgi:hypothetical protein